MADSYSNKTGMIIFRQRENRRTDLKITVETALHLSAEISRAGNHPQGFFRDFRDED
jgi:hypothetical protein